MKNNRMNSLPFSQPSPQEFFLEIGLKDFHLELEDKKHGTYYRWTQQLLDRKTSRELNIVDEDPEFTAERIRQFKQYERILKNSHTRKKIKEFNIAVILGTIDGLRFMKILDYIEKEVKQEKEYQYPIGTIHISKSTTNKTSTDIMKMSTALAQNIIGFDIIVDKWREFSKYHIETSRLLFYLQSLYKEKILGNTGSEKGLEIFDLNLSAKKKFSIFDYKTRIIIEKEGDEEGIEFVLFSFYHKDKASSKYKELLKQLQGSKDSSYNRSSEGEKLALKTLKNISISCSDLSEILDKLHLAKQENKKINHMSFDSSIKFFFITKQNFIKYPQEYAKAIFNYYGGKLGEQIKNIVIDTLETNNLENTKEDKEFSNFSKLYLQEFEDNLPLRGDRIILLTIPKFMIDQYVNFDNLIQTVGFISAITSRDMEIRNRLAEDITKHPYIKKLSYSEKKRRIQLRIRCAFAVICNNILLLPGNNKLYIDDFVKDAIRDQAIDKKLFHGIRPSRVASNKKAREEKGIVFDDDNITFEESEIMIVFRLLREYTFKLIEKLNEEKTKYYIQNDGKAGYITRGIPKKNKEIKDSE